MEVLKKPNNPGLKKLPTQVRNKILNKIINFLKALRKE